ncbi:MAG TPA: hypothetical protein DGG94_14510 [Micromonosporaceae bacterium]|nr:hypothetical protein [Micromonosporaceae bacterium]
MSSPSKVSDNFDTSGKDGDAYVQYDWIFDFRPVSANLDFEMWVNEDQDPTQCDVIELHFDKNTEQSFDFLGTLYVALDRHGGARKGGLE